MDRSQRYMTLDLKMTTTIEIGALDNKKKDTFVRRGEEDATVSNLKRNKCSIRTFRMTMALFSCDGYSSPTRKGLRSLLACIPDMNQLEDVELGGGMLIENNHDVDILTAAFRDHGSLRKITLDDFIVYATEFPKNGAHDNSSPLLEPLFVETSSSLLLLESLNLKCYACHKRWTQSFVSPTALIPLCQSTSLQTLTLSNLGLTDDHFMLLADQIAQTKGSVLTELVLNDNRNSDKGIYAIVNALLSKDSIIEKLEMLNNRRPNKCTSELLLDRLETNYTIKHLKINSQHQYRNKIEFYLLLNRMGRKTMSDPKVKQDDFLAILENSKDNPSLFMYFLRENPSFIFVKNLKIR
mmetsp:Transcript_23805/g.44238  ORF Transcript_23805/g.44238 Transcript_23805/m.44238 type:complete len:353 (-) Transcript_23805:59-1117(-)